MALDQARVVYPPVAEGALTEAYYDMRDRADDHRCRALPPDSLTSQGWPCAEHRARAAARRELKESGTLFARIQHVVRGALLFAEGGATPRNAREDGFWDD